MLSDDVLALMASSAIKQGYNNNNLMWNGNGYSISTLYMYDHCNVIQIIKDNKKTFMFCQQGSQTASDYIVYLQATRNIEKIKVKDKNGEVAKTMWNEYLKYANLIEEFYYNFKNDGDIKLINGRDGRI